MKTIFFGSSNYCISLLNSLNDNFNLTAIVTKTDSAVQKYAQKHNIKVFIPKERKELLGLISPIRQIKPDLAVVADYGLIIPKEIFEIPRYKTLNIHFSKLPKFRGPSPVQYTILSGEKNAGISVIIMDEELDTGDIIWQKEVKLSNGAMEQWSNKTAESLYQKLFNIIAEYLPDVISKHVNNELKPQKQDHTKTTYTRYLTREDGFIPPQLLDMAIKGINPSKGQLLHWSLYNSLADQFIIYHLSFIIERACRALSPWPGVWTTIALKTPRGWQAERSEAMTPPTVEESQKTDNKRLKILKAHIEPTTHNSQPITKFIPDLVQLEGKKPVTWKQFTEGYPSFKFSGNTSLTIQK